MGVGSLANAPVEEWGLFGTNAEATKSCCTYSCERGDRLICRAIAELHLHTKTSKAGRTSFDVGGLAKAFNERVLQRPEGSNMRLKCTRWINEYTQY